MHYDSFARHFLEVFDELIVVGRVFPVEDPSARPVIGPRVSFVPIPAYRGPGQFVRQAPRIVALLWNLMKPGTAFVLRTPGTIPSIFAFLARLRGVPYALQCVANPRDQLGKGAVRHPLRRFFQQFFIRNLQRQCREAGVTSYVTRKALQAEYPPGPGKPTFTHTDLVLDDAAYRDPAERQPPARHAGQRPWRIANVGMMSQLYKGQDILIHAIARCVEAGHDVHLTLVGDGHYRRHFEELVAELGLGGRVTFTGTLHQGSAVRQILDLADLFVLPSRQEGLPRALLEAMSRGLPCIASDVGGNPELLQPQAIVPSGDAGVLADRIAAFLNDPHCMEVQAAANYATALEYRFSAVAERRFAFYRSIHALALQA
ncbi:glycosyltransferase family 4 protein [Geminicoccus flavidas]|uniref:glycosyltransferase family 4 protein n=1 Tax=Geminicoccus flavidas TaxID=2506407 RepID=UPI00135B1A56|nr:glycosyltransferase family 4 protein [Geminicoccus flavidas]